MLLSTQTLGLTFPEGTGPGVALCNTTSTPHALNKHGLTEVHLKVGVELLIHKHSSRAYEVPGGTKETRVLTSEVLPVPGGRGVRGGPPGLVSVGGRLELGRGHF